MTSCAVRLCGVFEQRHVAIDQHLGEAFEGCDLSVEIDADHRPSSVGDSIFDLARIDEQIVVAAVDEHDVCAGAYDRLGRRDERIGGKDHFIATPDAQTQQHELDRIGPVADTDAMLRPGERGKLLFEGADRRSTDERRVGQHVRKAGGDLIGDLCVLRPQIDEGDVLGTHGIAPCARKLMSCPDERMNTAGTPAHTSPGGTDLVTTDPMPMRDHTPMVRCSRIIDPEPR